MSKSRLQLTWYNKDKALIPTEAGKYGYMWVDPADPRYCETHTLVVDGYVEGVQTPKDDMHNYSARADLEPQTDNLLINGESGDVLEALTRVPELAEKYVGNIKLVYIDPPFNTSQTFDSYEDNLEHSIWLTMIRDRLLNLKRLLSDDGSIWVHLDDMEVHRMRLLLDEVFGSVNFVAEIAWEKTFKPRNDARLVSGRHDVLLVYRRSPSFFLNKLPRTAAMNSAYLNDDKDQKGPWTSAPATGPGAKTHQGMVFGIQHPITGEIVYPPNGQCWRFGQDGFLQIMKGWNPAYELQVIDDAAARSRVCGIDESEVRPDVPALIIPNFDSCIGETVYERGQWPIVYITRGGRGGFRKKTYLSDMDGRAIEDLWFTGEVGSNDEAKNEIKALFPGETPFATPKPERLLERIIHIGTNPGDIMLDCFAGSGTTAAVAQKMGRRWVTCELLESNFNDYTKPRLEKVVNNEDPGGITAERPERVADEGVELPDGVSADDAAKFTSILNKLVADDEELKKDQVVKQLKKMTKTKKTKTTLNWRGGGGFTVAHLSPACFDYDPELDRTVLTSTATGDALICSIAANLGFKLLDLGDWSRYDGYYFEGYRGDTVLKVWEGVATTELVDWLVSRLHEGQTMVLAATGVVDGVREHLRKLSRGSRIFLVPDEVFSYSKES
ncbi:site-specific DNA-methyltransferase [Lancefieldella parvula]|uniref:site-specific DNA-methyltransferase n=1 Tax=Lancefieldella parvula TaxID=1382 RepID=UPI0028D5E119|nr:site-specific DNA-methyltransferase [Lancefieldella parvula]